MLVGSGVKFCVWGVPSDSQIEAKSKASCQIWHFRPTSASLAPQCRRKPGLGAPPTQSKKQSVGVHAKPLDNRRPALSASMADLMVKDSSSRRKKDGMAAVSTRRVDEPPPPPVAAVPTDDDDEPPPAC